MKMDNEMELMESLIEEVPGFDEMRASHNDLLSVQRVWWLKDDWHW